MSSVAESAMNSHVVMTQEQTDKYLAEPYREAVREARRVLTEKGACARYAAFTAASNYVSAHLSDEVCEGGEAVRSFLDQGEGVHQTWISEAVLCAELMGSAPRGNWANISDTVSLPEKLFTEILPSVRGAITRKLLFWCIVLQAATGRCAMSEIEAARVLRCPLQAVYKAKSWLMTHGFLAYDPDAIQDDIRLVAAINDNRDPIAFCQRLISSLGDNPFRTRWNDLSASGESCVPVALSQCYYDFDYVYWTQFSAAYSEPVDLLAVLTKGEREEILQLTNSITGHGSCPMFEPMLREISHLAATTDEVRAEGSWTQKTVVNSDGDEEVVKVPTPAFRAWNLARLLSYHLVKVPVHGRNRRSRAYRIAANRAGVVPGW